MPLELIPVIDLMHGQVVHARLGQRAHYLPLRSALAGGSSEPLRVAAALLALHPFQRLYIADLDAIAGRGDHAPVIAAIRQAHPNVELWLDSGLDALPERGDTTALTVLGSESLRTLPSMREDASTQAHAAAAMAVVLQPLPRRWVLSLDFRAGQLLGPPGLLQQTAAWPDAIIVMALDRVGGAQGPDLQRLHALQAGLARDMQAIARAREMAPAQVQASTRTRRLYAAGGVRDARDLAALAQAGAHGVLLASALHDGRLSACDLRRHADGG